MAVGPVRALLSAHLQATVNRSRKELGNLGATLLAVLLGSFAVLALLPLALGSGVVGWVVGRVLHQDKGVYVLGAVLTLLTVGGGLVGGALGGTRVLDWESCRVYPLRFRSLFLGELLAGLGDAMPLVLSLGMTCFLLGIAFAHPVLLPLLLVLVLASVLVFLLLQALVGFLAAAVVKRLQVGLLLLGAGAWAASVLSLRLPAFLEKGSGALPRSQQLEAFGRAALRVLDLLPATQAARGLSELLRGGWGVALLRFLYPVASLLLLLALGAWSLSREALATSSPPETSRGPERLWSFASPAEGLARLHWRTLITSHIGRFGFLVPLMTVVLLKGPLAHAKHQALWGLPLAFLYLGLTSSQMQFNQFGLDGPGIKALLLLPVNARSLLLGKCLGLAAYQGLQVLLLALLLVLAGGAPPAALAAALVLAACVFLAQTALGHWTSAWLPRPMPRDSLKNSNVALPVMLIGMAATTTLAGCFGGAYLLLAWLAPAALLPGMLLLLGGTLLAYRALLPLASTYLDARREALLGALG